MIHTCYQCGRVMTKVKGTKGVYECKKCGIRLNPSKKASFNDVAFKRG